MLPDALTARTSTCSTNPCPEAQFRSNAAGAPLARSSARRWPRRLCFPRAESGSVVIVAAAQSNGLPRLGVDLHGPLSLQLLGDFAFIPGLGQKFTQPAGHPDLELHLRFKQGGLVMTADEPLHGARSRALFPVSFLGWNGVSRNAKSGHGPGMPLS